MHSDIPHTTINMCFFKTYIVCTIWSEIAIRKGSTSSNLRNIDCSTLQTSRANQPTPCIYIHKHTQTTVSPCIHSFIHSIQHIHSITLSQERTTHHHCHSSQSSSINLALHGPLSMAFVQARMTLPLLAHNGMHLHAYRLPITSQRYIHRDDNFLPHTECADEHLRWWS